MKKELSEMKKSCKETKFARVDLKSLLEAIKNKFHSEIQHW